ncbi:MAG: DUF2240 family protein [Candidatus Thorarchaeota archaeon]
MTNEAYINKIIEETGLTRKEIENLVEEKKIELRGLISDEGALFIIAKELGVDVKDESKEILKDIEINISDITLNMKNIVLIGRIKEIYRIHEFNKGDGGIGHVGSFLLHDKSGDTRVVLWDENTKIFEDPNFEINELVKILNGNAKEGRYGDIEIHIGKFGKVILSPEDVDYNKYPKIKSTFTSIDAISLSLPSVSIEGKIIQKTPLNIFTKKDGTPGKVRSINLIDSTGTIRITFWNDDTEKINDYEIGDFISITHLNPRLSNIDSNTIELYANKNSLINKKDKKLIIEAKLVDNIKLLQNQRNIVSLQGIISSIDNLKKVSLKSGEELSLLSFIVSDETDGIRVTLWRDKAEEFSEKLTVGAGILLKNVMVKYSTFSGRSEISYIDDSSIDFVDLDMKNIKSIELPNKQIRSDFTKNYTKINQINSSGVFELKGFIVKELNNITIYEACSNCFKKIDNCICDEKGELEHRMIFNVIIDDESGTIRTTFIGDKAEKLIGESTETILIIKETPDFNTFLEKKSAELLGKDIIIKGRAKFSDFSNSYEIIAYDFQELNVNEELEKVIKDIPV